MDGLSWSWPDTRAPVDLPAQDGALPSPMQGVAFALDTNMTTSIINELRLAASRSARTSFVILASFNAVAGAALASAIFFDCWAAAKRTDPRFRLTRTSLLRLIGPVETFPFVLACGIAAQSIIFAAVQSKGLDGILLLGCASASQAMLPTLFIVPYIHLVFGLETMQRAFRRHPFPERPRYTVPACLAIIVVALLATYGVARATMPPNLCLGSLLWFVRPWTLGCFALLLATALVLLIGAIGALATLHRTMNVGRVERMSAAWTACYLLLEAATLSVVIPLFWHLYVDTTGQIRGRSTQLTMASTVAANLSGLTSGALYIALRSTRLGKIGPEGYLEFDRQMPSQKGKRSSTPGTAMYTKQMELPVSPVYFDQGGLATAGDGPKEAGEEEKTTGSPAASPPAAFGSTGATGPRAPSLKPAPAPAPGEPGAAVVRPARRPSVARDTYSIFPSSTSRPGNADGGGGGAAAYVLPAATYDPAAAKEASARLADATAPGGGWTDDAQLLLPPPPPRAAGGSAYDSWVRSSATVQIGLRVSNINDMPPVTSYYDTPHQRGSGNLGLAVSTYSAASLADAPEAAGEPAETLPPLAPLAISKKGAGAQGGRPHDQSGDGDGSQVTLSPSVYMPDAQPSPKDWGKGTEPLVPRVPPARLSPALPPRDRSPRRAPRVTEWI